MAGRDGAATCPRAGAALACLVAGAVHADGPAPPGIAPGEVGPRVAGPPALPAGPAHDALRGSAAGGVVVSAGSRRTSHRPQVCGRRRRGTRRRHHRHPTVDPPRTRGRAIGPCLGAPAGGTPTMTQVWPGSRLPARGHVRRHRHQLRDLQRGGREGRAVPLRRRRQRGARSGCPRWTPTSGTPSCPASSPASATASACTARTTRRRACAATRTSCCSTPTPRPSTAQIDWDQSVLRLRLRRPRSATTTTRRRTCRSPSSINPYFDWGVRPPAEDAVQQVGHLRGPRQGPDDDRTRDVPEELRGTYAGVAHPAIDRAPDRPRHHRDRAACRCTSSCRTTPC